MPKKTLGYFVLGFLAAMPGAYHQVRAQAQKVSYPAMAPVG